MREDEDIDWGPLGESADASAPSDQDSDAAPKLDHKGQEVMRGDLEQMSLMALFQTVAVSKMEGMLTLSNPRQERYLYFSGGAVRDLVFGRPTHQRLGERLMAAGLISEDQLKVALMEQSSTKRPLGEVLVQRGVLSKSQLEGVADYQACEDLHSLFTWKRGAFEFHKGAPEDERLLARLDVVPQFDVVAIQEEAARRQDEWVSLLASIDSVDEILRPVPGALPASLDYQHGAVMEFVNGERSIQELSELSLLGLFDCARVCRDLIAQGLVERLSAEDLLATAETQFGRGDTKNAVVAMRTLFDRGDEGMSLDLAKRLAAAMHRCGDSRLGARCLWRAAENPAHREASLELLRHACELDTRSSYPLRALQETLRRLDAPDEQITEVTSQLVDALSAEGQDDEALAEFAWLEAHTGDLVAVLSRKTRILQKLGRTAQAVEALEQLAEIFAASKRHGPLGKVYEQILMQDPRRKDIAKALMQLSSSQRGRQLRRAVVAAVVLAVGLGGYTFYRQNDEADRIQQTVADLSAMLNAGRLDGVEARLNEATAELGPLPELDKLRQRLYRHRDLSVAQFAREREKLAQPQLERAADHLERGELDAALKIYEQLLVEPKGRAVVQALIKERANIVLGRLGKLASTLPERIPAPPGDFQTAGQHEGVLAALREHFLEADRRLAEAAMRAAERPVLATILGREDRDAMIASATAVAEVFVAADESERLYRKAHERTAAKERLQPLFEAAQRHEAALEFEPALRAYERLIADFPGQGPLVVEFGAKAERYRIIVDRLRELDSATDAGDHKAALGHLTALRQLEPNLPFGKVARLPLQIATTPPGAEVTVNGERIADRTPVRTSYLADTQPTVELQLPGFVAKTFKLPESAEGRAAVLLSKAPDWAKVAPGSVQRQPVCDGEGHVFLVDRSGTILRIEMNGGDVAWRVSSGDLSGLLTRPALIGDRLVVGSFDGPLRAFDRESAREVWRADDLPCEAAPAMVGTVLVIATIKGEAVGLRPDTGTPRYRIALPGPVHADLAVANERAFAVTRNGHVVCLRPDGKIAWSKEVAQSIIASPAVGSGVVVVATDGGILLALDTGDGRELWRTSGLGELVLCPAIVGDRVVVAGAYDLNSFALANGQRGPVSKSQNPWSSAPVLAGGKLFAGNQAGIVFVLDPETLRARYLIRGNGKISAPVGVDSRGGIIAAFENKVVQGFRQLP